MASRPKTARDTVAAVVLAGGRGKRMKSARPKVLHEVCGWPALRYVLEAARAARPSTLAVVVRAESDEVEEVVRSWRLTPEPVFVAQGEPLGTGHAVMVAEGAAHRADTVLVLAGDDPLVTPAQVRELLRAHRRTEAAATILTTNVDDPTGFSRIRREGNRLIEIVLEDVADRSSQLRDIHEVSTLVYAFRRQDLFGALPLVSRENRQHEYYLPDVLTVLLDKGERVSAVLGELGGGMGLNTRAGLAKVQRIMRDRLIAEHMRRGVTFLDPGSTYLHAGVRIGRDSVIQPMSFLEGNTRIGARCTVGPATRIVDSTVGDDADVTFSVVRGARIAPKATVGPYASIRPGTVIEEGGKVGTFVEIKASRVGKRSKVPHLSYVGDATIGAGANLGAGTVTVNYDGFEKHRTQIGEGANVGSDTMLVAPVKIGKNAWTGAGSTITRDVPDGALAVERSEQRIVVGYDRRKQAARAGGSGDAGSGRRRRRRGSGGGA